MERVTSSGGRLRVTARHCETAYTRHRVPRTTPNEWDIPSLTSLKPDSADAEAEFGIFGLDTDNEPTEGGSTDSEANDDALSDNDGPLHNAPQMPLISPDSILVLNSGGNQVLNFGDTQENDPALDPEPDSDPDLESIPDPESVPDPEPDPVPDPESDSESDSEPNNILPQIAVWRLNLTALSQRFNFYVVAYRDQLHISMPRSCVTNALPAQPDLILQPGPSAAAASVIATISPGRPHQANHLIIGDLGEEEILLLAYDDGDVIAFYTREIERELVDRQQHPAHFDNDNVSDLQPFFHENVAGSAWGLAIHKKSRILAVGSNNHEITLFIYALTGTEYQYLRGESRSFFRTYYSDLAGGARIPPYVEDDITRHWSEGGGVTEAVGRRDANWRVIFRIGPNGSNIPNLTFTNFANGGAEKVIAVDIKGCLWLINIWHLGEDGASDSIDSLHRWRNPRTRVLLNPPEPRGWGVLVLPESSFLPTDDSFEDALGVPLSKARFANNDKIGGRWIDTSKSIGDLENNSNEHPWVRYTSLLFRFFAAPIQRSERKTWFEDSSNAFWAASGWRGRKDTGLAIGGPRTRPTLEEQRSKWILEDGSSILRTYEEDIELRSFEEGGVGIMCERIIYQKRYHVMPGVPGSHERLSNLIHVPQLALVIAGSMCGRVALVTLTRVSRQLLPFKRGFKVEIILPTEKEEDKGIRPICPLLGVAISPMPLDIDPDEADACPLGPRRYRLMLHYYDLRILSYEIYRDSMTNELSIF